jgi:catechol 2,3-dioxygenase-like lactoylglutathione lyase family enzyme
MSAESIPMPRMCQVVLDTTDARASAEFWRQLLGLVYRPGHEPPSAGEIDVTGRDWLNLLDPDGNPRLAFQQVPAVPPTTWPDPPDVPQQLHLVLTVANIEELEYVHHRVLALGGKLRLDRSHDPDEPHGCSSIRPGTRSASSSPDPRLQRPPRDGSPAGEPEP